MAKAPTYKYNPGRSVDDEGNATSPPPSGGGGGGGGGGPAPSPGLPAGIDFSFLQPHITAYNARQPFNNQGFYGVSGGPGGYQQVPAGGSYNTSQMQASPYAAAYSQGAKMAQEAISNMAKNFTAPAKEGHTPTDGPDASVGPPGTDFGIGPDASVGPPGGPDFGMEGQGYGGPFGGMLQMWMDELRKRRGIPEGDPLVPPEYSDWLNQIGGGTFGDWQGHQSPWAVGEGDAATAAGRTTRGLRSNWLGNLVQSIRGGL